VDAVARGKGEMYRGLRPGSTACVPSYDARLLGEARNVQQGVRVITFGERTDDEVRLHQVTPRGFDGIVAVLSVGGFLFEAPIPLLGAHLGYNALAAAAAAHALGLGPPSIARGLAEVRPVPGRLCPVRDLDGVDVLDDTYNANPASVLAGLEVLSTVSAAPRRAVAVLGDMLELGPGSADAHAQVGAGLVAAGVERALLFGPEMRHAAGALASAGFADRAFHTESFEAARDRLLADVRPGDVVLVKGSRGMRTERFIEALRAARPPRAQQK
jgi:UDP-N-acetylmuramoyl-tripeptide--D-alanyl-D-alanine ligase